MPKDSWFTEFSENIEVMDKETDRESEIKRMKMEEHDQCMVISEKKTEEQVSHGSK